MADMVWKQDGALTIGSIWRDGVFKVGAVVAPGASGWRLQMLRGQQRLRITERYKTKEAAMEKAEQVAVAALRTGEVYDAPGAGEQPAGGQCPRCGTFIPTTRSGGVCKSCGLMVL